MSYTVSKCYHMLATGQTCLPASFLKDLWSEGAGASRLLSYPNATTDLRDQQHAALHTPTGACQHSHHSYKHLPQKLQKGVSSSEFQRERSASLSHKHIRLQTCNSSMLPQVSRYTSPCLFIITSTVPPLRWILLLSRFQDTPSAKQLLEYVRNLPNNNEQWAHITHPQTDPLLSPSAHSQLTQLIHFLVNKRK